MKNKTLLTVIALALATMLVFAASGCAKNTPDEFVADGVQYTKDGNAYIVTGHDDNLTGKLEILSEYGGVPVTGIKAEAFSKCENLLSVKIPQNVTEIGKRAFEYCGSLETLSLPNSLRAIGKKTFGHCGSLTVVSIPEGVEKIDDGAFEYCVSLVDVTIPETVTEVGEGAFAECSPDCVIHIADPDQTTNWDEDWNEDFPGTVKTDEAEEPEATTEPTAAPAGDPNAPEEYVENGVEYTRQTDFYAVTGCTDDLPAEVTLLDSYCGWPVTEIWDWAFRDCTVLASITIPDSVTSIGELAFGGCISLASIAIPDSVTVIEKGAFYDTPWYDNQPEGVVYAGKVAYDYKGTCPSTVALRDDTKSIADGAFESCESLTSITIPNGVTSIGRGAFRYCASLTNIEIPDSVISIRNIITGLGDGAFDDTPWYDNQPEGVVYVGKVVYGYKGFSPSTVVLRDDTKGIADCAFGDCASLNNITIPNSVINIGMWAFFGCTSLTSITIPDRVTSIEEWAFSGCDSLTSITIPNSVTSIRKGAFEDCSNLVSFTVASDNPVYYSEGNCIIRKNNHVLVAGCNNSAIPNDITGIGDYAFSGCDSLTSVSLSNSVTSIGDYAFYGCDSLTSITIPNSVISIGDWAFGWCISLTNITIPNSVTSIGYKAFYGCPSGCVIYCAAASEPAGWDVDWDYGFDGTVKWGVTK